MLKNKAWIVALFAALAMAFIGFGCTDAGLDFSPPEPEKGEYENIELGEVGFKGGQPGNQQGWYSIGYTDDGLLGTPVATVQQFVTAKYLVVRLKSPAPNSISGETAAVQIIWGGDGEGWKSGTNITVSSADEAVIRYDAEANELWVELSKALAMYSDYAALKTGARLVLQSWNYSDAYDTAYLVVPTDPTSVEPPSVEVPTTYIVPKAGGTFFYLNLNDYQTEGAVNNHVPEGELTKTQLTVFFRENDQRANFPLTAEQVKAIKERKSGTDVTVTVTGYASSFGGEVAASTTPFRYHLGNAKVADAWNGTTNNTTGPFTGSNYNAPVTLGFVANPTDALLGYFILQQRAAAETEVVIRSIKFTYTPDLDPVEVEAEANEAFPEGIEGANGPEFTDSTGQKWLVMAMKTYDGNSDQPHYDYNTDSSGGASGANKQQYPSEIRTQLSALSESYSIYDTVKVTIIARELTSAELAAKGWTASGTGDLQIVNKARSGQYSAGTTLTGANGYPAWGGSVAKGDPIVLSIPMSELASGGEWDGFIFAFNDWQWNTPANNRISPFLIRIEKIEIVFDD